MRRDILPPGRSLRTSCAPLAQLSSRENEVR
jgi:hypothetical protein